MTHTRHYKDYEYMRSNGDGEDSKVAQKIIDMGLAKNFIAITVGMLDDYRCDLDGHVAYYANDLQAIKRKAVHELEEEE